MILMNKYNKIMEKVKVTPEMHDRIMCNIQETDFKVQPSKLVFLQNYKRYMGIVACLLVCVCGTVLFTNRVQIPQETPQQVIPDIVEYSSKQELSSCVGFEVKEVQNIPFHVDKVQYIAYWKRLAQVEYIGADNRLTFRMTVDTEDISGDYTSYQDIKSYAIASTNVTIKGNDGLYQLAVWQEGEFSYALQLEMPISQADLEEIIQSVK